ncbi:acetaldehyde dehydrogenase (acetylating) [Sporosarcina sp. P18a]|uniref:acetaldehyde dehydrogenase (acetylating) n=1 Tax=Sporosarcina sp. P18a TaxID=2048259 RepID=UPI000C16B128|nr:acetaldehyde dehydrogenase (acetylating) [Sporosarcina sp. P18a]PIC78779.1 acetaldehyde dehydrogenase (acetylating) [Sporosarcina sp. P18a]
MKKVKVAILGSGNIGTDLLLKLSRSPILELTTMIGIDAESDGLKKAAEHGYEVITTGIDGFLERPELADIIFDATSAKAHIYHDEVLRKAGKKVIDMTPAAIGPIVVPPVNLDEHLDADNINLITCGGQATIPIIHAVHQVQAVEYGEIVSTISSQSAGPGTRANIDEFTQTTTRGILEVGGAKRGKAIILLNPAEPPILMRNTIHIQVEEEAKTEEITASIREMEKEVQSYVPGYRLRQEPIFDGKDITVFVEVEGVGDYLPTYSGNLDIMTASSVKMAEEWAKHKVANIPV